jgi:hypothetical protein
MSLSRKSSPIGLDLPLTALVGVAGRRRKILTCTQINKTIRAKLE